MRSLLINLRRGEADPLIIYFETTSTNCAKDVSAVRLLLSTNEREIVKGFFFISGEFYHMRINIRGSDNFASCGLCIRNYFGIL